jgi:hypothetical protein
MNKVIDDMKKARMNQNKKKKSGRRTKNIKT